MLKKKVNKIMMFAVIALMVFAEGGCANVVFPENVHLRTVGKYRQMRVGIFRFESVVDAPRAGEMAADLLYKQLLKDRVFQDLYANFSAEDPLSLEDQLRVARDKGYDLIIRGRVLQILEGGMLESSQVGEEIAVIEVASEKMLWYAEAFESGDPVIDADYILWSSKARQAPSTRTLMEKNSRKFSRLLNVDSR